MKFDQCRGNRLHKQFMWITNFSGLWYDGKSWSENPEGDHSNCCRCRTLRAFRRHLRKHTEIRGKAILVSRFTGYDIYA